MSIRSMRKIGTVMAIAMLIGTVVGIGIFFKSHGVLRANDWNGIGTLMAWILGGILSIAAAVSFSEIGSFKTKKVHGLPGWAEKIGGKKLGYFTRFNFSFFYIGILTAVLGFFGSEMIFMMIATFSKTTMGDIPIYAHVILGLFISSSFLVLNFLSARTGGKIQVITTFLKWIPLVIVALFGILLANINNSPSAVAPSPEPQFGQNAFTNGRSFKFTGMLAALPGVLFAFDAFLGVASMRGKMEKPKKLPIAIFFGMLAVTVLYLFIALAAILHGSGMVTGLPFGAPASVGLGIFDQIFAPQAAEIIGKFTVVFLVISTLGVINGISAWSVSLHEQTIETDTVFGVAKLKSKIGTEKSIITYTLILNTFWTLMIGIPALVLNSDSIIDGVSNFPTLFAFGLFAIIIGLYLKKRKQFQETSKMNTISFHIAAITAIIGIALVVFYQIFYGFTVDAFLHPSETTHWGLFAGDSGDSITNFPSASDVSSGVYMSKIQGFIVFAIFGVLFIGLPFLNRFLKRKFEKKDPEVAIETVA